MAEIRTTPLPQLRESSRTVIDRAVASPKNMGFQAPSVTSSSAEAEGLVRGLASFNANLGQFTDYSIREERQRVTELVSNEAAAVAARADGTKSIEENLSQDVPANVPVAYGKMFKETLGSLLVDREALRASKDWTASFHEASKDPNFDVEAFIKEQRGKTLGGLTDASLVGRMGGHIQRLEGSIRAEAEKQRIAKLEETATSGMLASVEANIQPGMTPDEVAAKLSSLGDAFVTMGRSRKETAAMVLGRISFLSEQMNGTPELFTAFEKTDPKTGQSFLTLNPELAGMVTQARTQALNRNKAYLEEASQKDNLPKLDAYNKDLETNPAAITLERVMQDVGRHGVFASTEQAASILHRARVALGEQGVNAQVDGAVSNGTLWMYDPQVQKKGLDRKYGSLVQSLAQRSVEGDQEALNELAKVVVAAQSSAGSSITIGAMERFVQAATQNLNGSTPTPATKAAASLYSILSANPAVRDRYFNEDASQLLRQYNAAIQGGNDENAAYAAAVRSVSPEAKEQAKKLIGTDAFKDKVKAAAKEVEGSSFLPSWLGGNGRVSNPESVTSAATVAARQYLERNPNADPKDAVAYANQWVSRNFVMDESTQKAVKVPEGMADPLTREAITEYSKRLAEVYRLSDRNDGEWGINFMPSGENGVLQVTRSDGAAHVTIGHVNVATLRDAFQADKVYTDVERQQLSQIKAQLTAGTLDPALVEQAAPALAKARSLRSGLPAEMLKQVDRLQLDTVKRNLDAMPKFSMDTPTLEGLQFVPQRGVKVDNKLTASIAKKFALSGVPGSGSPAMGLAASLVTMGEAVVLKASPDPNPQAGNNIGMGYNLKANEKTARQDLQRAGVSPDKVDAVINGQAQLTPDQAMRLTQVALPRYEKLARDTAEKTAPGLWGRMTQFQQAVMVDIAWQTGNPEQFRRAWSAVASGNNEAFINESKVFYKNAKGEKVEDKRRNDLRAAMLNGHAQWQAVIDRYGSFPTNSLDAVALNQPK